MAAVFEERDFDNVRLLVFFHVRVTGCDGKERESSTTLAGKQRCMESGGNAFVSPLVWDLHIRLFDTCSIQLKASKYGTQLPFVDICHSDEVSLPFRECWRYFLGCESQLQNTSKVCINIHGSLSRLVFSVGFFLLFSLPLNLPAVQLCLVP